MTMFKVWEAKVNDLMLKKHGVGIDDIPDQPWHDWWINNVTPEEAVKTAIEYVNNGEWV